MDSKCTCDGEGDCEHCDPMGHYCDAIIEQRKINEAEVATKAAADARPVAPCVCGHPGAHGLEGFGHYYEADPDSSGELRKALTSIARAYLDWEKSEDEVVEFRAGESHGFLRCGNVARKALNMPLPPAKSSAVLECDYCGEPAIESVLDHVLGARIDYCAKHDPARVPMPTSQPAMKKEADMERTKKAVQATIAEVLEENDGFCMDNDQERFVLTHRLEVALRPYTQAFVPESNADSVNSVGEHTCVPRTMADPTIPEHLRAWYCSHCGRSMPTPDAGARISTVNPVAAVQCDHSGIGKPGCEICDMSTDKNQDRRRRGESPVCIDCGGEGEPVGSLDEKYLHARHCIKCDVTFGWMVPGPNTVAARAKGTD